MFIKSLFDKISLKKKLFIIPVVVFMLLMVLWYIFHTLVSQQSKTLNHISKCEISAIIQINKFFSEVTLNHSDIQSLLLEVPTQKDKKKISNQGKPLIEKLHLLEEEYKKLNFKTKHNTEKSLKKNIDTNFKSYISSTIAAINMASIDYKLASFYIYGSEGSYTLLDSDFQILISEIENRIQIDVKESLVNMANNSDIFFIAISLFILILFYFTFGFSRNLSIDLNDILESIKSLSKEEIDREIPIYKKGNDFHQISIALEKLRTEIIDKKKAKARLKLTAKVFENTAEMIVVTDNDNKIIEVNKAFTTVTGYSKEEALGNNPSILKSGYQNNEFYKNMWGELLKNDYWQGEIWNRKKNGALVASLLTISSINDSGKRYFIAVSADITRLKESQERAEFLAYHDTLTNLPNRILFSDRLEVSIQRTLREGKKFALLFIDLDKFKNINDTLGHQVGDIFLQETAKRIKKSVRPEDTVARIGGDEFIALIDDIKDENFIVHIADRILTNLAKPVVLESRDAIITSSIGISIYPNDGDNAEALIKNADTAMYEAKSLGRNNFQFYRSDLTRAAKERFALENDLRKVLLRDELILKYQPQMLLETDEMIGVEVLLRWKHHTKGFISPEIFIRIAEEIGMINDIGKWVFSEACKQGQKWKSRGVDSFRIAVNLSARQLMSSDLIDDFKKILDETQMDAKNIELEVTESYIMEHIDRCVDTLNQLKEMGFTLAIDDFGTGYSSLSYLKKLPIHRLKVDKSFVMDIYKNSDDTAITATILAMGRSLGLEVIAEGVEKQEQLDFLKRQGCEEVQGYFFSEPLLAQELEEWMEKRVKTIS